MQTLDFCRLFEYNIYVSLQKLNLHNLNIVYDQCRAIKREDSICQFSVSD